MNNSLFISLLRTKLLHYNINHKMVEKNSIDFATLVSKKSTLLNNYSVFKAYFLTLNVILCLIGT